MPPPAHPVPDDFVPEFFAHGRLLWRFEGSDAARFSPRLAWAMLGGAAAVSSGLAQRAELWDPFCGAGLIPAIARAFFGEAFGSVHASDASALAVATTLKNLQLVSDPEVLRKRLRQLNGLRGQNVKSDRRWGEVGEYGERLLPRVERAAGQDLSVRVNEAAAHELTPLRSDPDQRLFVVGDAPYGRASELSGPPLDEVFAAWLSCPAVHHIDVVCTADQASALASLPSLTFTAARAGRARARFTRAFDHPA